MEFNTSLVFIDRGYNPGQGAVLSPRKLNEKFLRVILSRERVGGIKIWKFGRRKTTRHEQLLSCGITEVKNSDKVNGESGLQESLFYCNTLIKQCLACPIEAYYFVQIGVPRGVGRVDEDA